MILLSKYHPNLSHPSDSHGYDLAQDIIIPCLNDCNTLLTCLLDPLDTPAASIRDIFLQSNDITLMLLMAPKNVRRDSSSCHSIPEPLHSCPRMLFHLLSHLLLSSFLPHHINYSHVPHTIT